MTEQQSVPQCARARSASVPVLARRRIGVALAYAGLAVVALHFTPAQAQSSVSVYGRVVVGLEYVDRTGVSPQGHRGSLVRLADNQWGTSMLDFSGVEDLGGGTKAHFLLESGFSSANGSLNGPSLFNRRAYLGLVNDRWGTLNLGENLFVSNDAWALDPTAHQYVSSATLVRGRNWLEANNMIEYTTPVWDGFTATGQWALGEQPHSSAALRDEGVSMRYAKDGLELRAILSRSHDQDGNYSDVYRYSKEAVLGATYQLGGAKLFGAIETVSAPNASAAQPSRLAYGWLGVRYGATASLTLIAAAYRVKADRIDGAATLLAAGADLHLSKQTLLYAMIGGVQNSASANFSADVTVAGPGPGSSQRAAYAGIAHTF